MRRQRQLADLIKKQAAAIGQFKLATPLVVRASKRAAHMAEQLAFYQVIGQRRAVEADQRPHRTRRSGMQGFSHQLFTHPGFAADQHVQLAVADQGDLRQQSFVRGTLPDQLPCALLPSDLLINLGQLVLVLGTLLQTVDPFAGHHSGSGKAGKRLQIVQVDATEACRVERVEGQQTPGLILHIQRATEAVVHGQVTAMAVDQPVIGVGHFTVGGKARRPALRKQGLQARVLAQFEASAEGVSAQAQGGQRHQHLALQPQ